MKKIFKIINNNLKLKILIPIVFLYFLASVVIYMITINSVKQTLQYEFTSKGKAIVNTLASSIQDTILNRDSSTVQNYIDQYRNVEGISFIIILDENNKILAHTFYPKVPDEYLKIAKEKIKNDLQVNEEVLNDTRELVISRPILNGLLGHIYMGMGIEKREREITRPLMEKIVLTIVTCVVILILLTNIFLNIILKPIVSLTQLAEGHANGKKNIIKSPVTTRDEVGRLTESFYLMVDKVEENTKWLEHEVNQRTKIINEQQITLLNASKMSALGEMAGGIAHEINTPLSIISLKVEQLTESVDENEMEIEEFRQSLDVIKSTTERIAKIVSGLRFFARDGSNFPFHEVNVESIIDETLSFCAEKIKLEKIQLTVKKTCDLTNLTIDCRAVEISQVLLNLLNNSSDAISDLPEKWIDIVVRDLGEEVEISVVDSGKGISKEIREKIMHPFFTTKAIGKGTGLGLSISQGIVNSHNGQLFIDDNSAHTKFTLILRKKIEKKVG